MAWHPNGRVALPLMASITIVAATCSKLPGVINLWGVQHTAQDDSLAYRVECPSRWGTVPLYRDAERLHVMHDSIRGWWESHERDSTSEKKDKYGNKPNEWSLEVNKAGQFLYHPASAEIGPAGAISNIPEFHDCQRFAADSATFGDLFAIFASFKLERITRALQFDDVTWSSSNPKVVSVDTNGNVIAVGVGTALITATSKVDQKRRGSTTVTVSPLRVLQAGLARREPEQNPVKREPSSRDRDDKNARPTASAMNAFAATTISVPSAELAHLVIEQHAVAVPQIGDVTPRSFAAAAIYAYGAGYSDLHIGPNFNCLYVYFDRGGALRGKIVHVDFSTNQRVCIDLVDPDTAPGPLLSVNRTPAPQTGDIPFVARWDRDPSTGQYFVGIACGDSWCEVGRRDASTSPGYAAAASTSPADRTIRVKGWYDQQVLAWNPARSTKPTSSGIIATVVPVDSLVEMADSTHFRNFVPVAHVALDATHALPGAVDYYQKEFNWSPAPVLYAGAWHPNELNLMELCFGNTTSCQIPRSALAGSRCPVSAPNGDTYVRWWLRVTAAGSGQVKYRCVTRRYHMEYSGKLPGTARWRWIIDDDTVWAECAQGCCQVERGDS